MRSEKQRAASRLNGAKSRGPVTASGKRNTSQNATKHGAFAQAILLPTESGEAFDLLAGITFEEFDPATPFEATLVEDMVCARWRAKRFAIIEQTLITQELNRLEQQAADTGEMSDLDAADITGLAFRGLADNSQALQLLHRYAVRFAREYLRSHRRLMEVQDRRRDTPPPTHPSPIVSQDIENQEQTRQPAENTEHTGLRSVVCDRETERTGRRAVVRDRETDTPNTNPAATAFLWIFAERLLAKPPEARTMAAPAQHPDLTSAPVNVAPALEGAGGFI